MDRLTAGNCAVSGNSENTITFDLNGNITGLSRYLKNSQTAQMGYNYTDVNANYTNQLQKITDASGVSTGMPSGTFAYGYDANGNMQSDNSKTLQVSYNLQNLPQINTLTGGTITYTYDAEGKKLRKVSTLGTGTTTDYIDGIQYNSAGTGALSMSFIQTEEGQVLTYGGTLNYEYNLTDHLGNTRLTFDTHQAGTASTVQQDDYMPFGMDISAGPVSGTKNYYLYNKKELQPELTLYDYGRRFYDPMVVRWTTVDPASEIYQHWSGYNYGGDNPIINTDPDGTSIEEPKQSTRFVDPSGNTILNTNDGRNDVFMVPWNRIKEFSVNIYWTNKADGDNGTDAIGWNTYWRGEFNQVLSESQVSEAGINTYKSEATKAAIVKSIITGTVSDSFAAAKAALLDRWSDPVFVANNAIAGLHISVTSGIFEPEWNLGSGKSAAKWAGQLLKRGWTPQQITDAIANGQSYPATNLINPGNPAMRYVNPATGQSVVIDLVTKEVIHMGGPGFKY